MHELNAKDFTYILNTRIFEFWMVNFLFSSIEKKNELLILDNLLSLVLQK